MLPKNRGMCGEDETETDFHIRTNDRDVVSEGSCLSKIHSKLISYLFNVIGRIE